jgi:hypothetical protein
MGHNLRIETLPTESLINRARNKFVTKFLDNKEFNGTHLLFIDADIGFTLQNILRVIDFNKDPYQYGSKPIIKDNTSFIT